MADTKVEEGAEAGVPGPSTQRDKIKHLVDDSQALCEGDTWYGSAAAPFSRPVPIIVSFCSGSR